MVERLLIETKEIGNHRIKIYYDTNAMCPCTDWDMAACFLWEYDKIARLSDACNWKEVFGKYGDSHHSLIDALHQLISEHVEWKDLLNYFKRANWMAIVCDMIEAQICGIWNGITIPNILNIKAIRRFLACLLQTFIHTIIRMNLWKVWSVTNWSKS